MGKQEEWIRIGEENRIQGRIAEGRFIGKMVELGIPVMVPLFGGLRYDFITDRKRVCRVQIKSTSHRHNGVKVPAYHLYATVPKSTGRKPYRINEIDILVVYIVPEDLWYVFPATEIVNRKHIILYPEGESKYNKYIEAWDLL